MTETSFSIFGKIKSSSIVVFIKLVRGFAITSADIITSFGGILSIPTDVPDFSPLMILMIFDGSALEKWNIVLSISIGRFDLMLTMLGWFLYLPIILSRISSLSFWLLSFRLPVCDPSCFSPVRFSTIFM